MSALLAALFVLGIVVALLVRASEAPQEQTSQPSREGTKLDTIDEMFLYGEVTDDEFYRM